MPYTNSSTEPEGRRTKSLNVARRQQSSWTKWARGDLELLTHLKRRGLSYNQICKRAFPTRSAGSCKYQYNTLEANRSPKIFVSDGEFLSRIYWEVLRKLGDSARERLLQELKVTNWKPEGY
jgi:hypothetical protein